MIGNVLDWNGIAIGREALILMTETDWHWQAVGAGPGGKAWPWLVVTLANEGGPLGIHVVPDYSPDSGAETGLLVQVPPPPTPPTPFLRRLPSFT